MTTAAIAGCGRWVLCLRLRRRFLRRDRRLFRHTIGSATLAFLGLFPFSSFFLLDALLFAHFVAFPLVADEDLAIFYYFLAQRPKVLQRLPHSLFSNDVINTTPLNVASCIPLDQSCRLALPGCKRSWNQAQLLKPLPSSLDASRRAVTIGEL